MKLTNEQIEKLQKSIDEKMDKIVDIYDVTEEEARDALFKYLWIDVLPITYCHPDFILKLGEDKIHKLTKYRE